MLRKVFKFHSNSLRMKFHCIGVWIRRSVYLFTSCAKGWRTKNRRRAFALKTKCEMPSKNNKGILFMWKTNNKPWRLNFPSARNHCASFSDRPPRSALPNRRFGNPICESSQRAANQMDVDGGRNALRVCNRGKSWRRFIEGRDLRISCVRQL